MTYIFRQRPQFNNSIAQWSGLSTSGLRSVYEMSSKDC